MSTENKNQPAFPTVNGYAEELGLTKREYFAAMAMQGILAGADLSVEDGRYTVNGKNTDTHFIAKESIAIADELLKQLDS